MNRADPTSHCVPALLLACGLAVLSTSTAKANDPIGDLLRGAVGDPTAVDATRLSATPGATHLQVQLEFTDAVQPPGSRSPTGLRGFIDLDTDLNPSTGQRSAAAFVDSGRADVLGSDLQIVLATYDEQSGTVDVVDQSSNQTVGSASVQFLANRLILDVPNALLEDPNQVHLRATVGSGIDASDVVPNGGYVTTANGAGIELQQGRFRVTVDWIDFGGATGSGTLVTQSNDSALFWFFTANNWELLVKVLDGCGVNDHFWVFAAATTNVAYTIRVTEVASGTVRVYNNSLGEAAASLNDIEAFQSCL